MKKVFKAIINISLVAFINLSLSISAFADIKIHANVPKVETEPNYKLYAFLAVIIILWIVFQGWPLLKKIIHVIKGVTSSIYLNKNSNLTPDQYRKLALGAIYSEQQTAFINSLNTGLDAAMLRNRLSEWWGINSRQDALQTLERLAQKGHRFFTPAVVEAFFAPAGQQLAILKKHFVLPEDLETADNQLENLRETIKELQDDKVIESPDDLKKYDATGWDVGRIVFVARLCYDSSYISDTEAWNFIEQANHIAHETFDSWKNFSKSYVIGRAIWGGKNSFNSGIASIANNLLENERSPWVQLSWK